MSIHYLDINEDYVAPVSSIAQWIITKECNVSMFSDDRGNATRADVEVTQDFALGTTTVRFVDGSALIFDGDSVSQCLGSLTARGAR